MFSDFLHSLSSFVEEGADKESTPEGDEDEDEEKGPLGSMSYEKIGRAHV